MNKEEIQERLNKRDAEINKYQSYIRGGKDADDGIVKKTLKKIEDLETTLLDSNVDFDVFNLNLEEQIIKNKEVASTKIKSNNNLINGKKRKIIKKEKINKKTIGVYISTELSEKLSKMSKLANDNENGVISTLLANMYDKEKKQLILKIDKKEKKSRLTSFAIDSEIMQAIENFADKMGYKKTEIFEMLVKKSLEEYDI